MLDRRTFIGAAGATFALSACGQRNSLERVLALSWQHSAEFAFLYAANSLGFAANDGFRFAETRGSQEVAQILQDGVAPFGLMGADVLMMTRAQGVPIKAIGIIYQYSPAVIVSREGAGIEGPQDLVGKRVGVISTSTVYKQYLGMLRAAAIDPASIEEVEAVRGGAQQFANGEFDALTQFSNFAPVTLEAEGIKVDEFPFHKFEVDLYGTCLVASETMIESEPDLCRELIAAIRKGQALAVTNPSTALSYVPSIAIDTAGDEVPMMQLQRTNELMSEGLGERQFGSMDESRWRKSQETLLATDQLDRALDIRFFFDDRFL